MENSPEIKKILDKVDVSLDNIRLITSEVVSISTDTIERRFVNLHEFAKMQMYRFKILVGILILLVVMTGLNSFFMYQRVIDSIETSNTIITQIRSSHDLLIQSHDNDQMIQETLLKNDSAIRSDLLEQREAVLEALTTQNTKIEKLLNEIKAKK